MLFFAGHKSSGLNPLKLFPNSRVTIITLLYLFVFSNVFSIFPLLPCIICTFRSLYFLFVSLSFCFLSFPMLQSLVFHHQLFFLLLQTAVSCLVDYLSNYFSLCVYGLFFFHSVSVSRITFMVSLLISTRLFILVCIVLSRLSSPHSNKISANIFHLFGVNSPINASLIDFSVQCSVICV